VKDLMSLKIQDIVSLASERLFFIIFVGIFIISCVLTYIFASNAALLDPKIIAKQSELARVIKLKEIYLARKHYIERGKTSDAEKKKFSLATIEDVVTKNFVTGNLLMLRPTTSREGRGRSQSIIEVKVSGVALKEVVSFIQTIESLGFSLTKLQLTMVQNLELLDVYAMVGERQ